MSERKPVVEKITYEYTVPMEVTVEVAVKTYYKHNLVIDRGDLVQWAGTEFVSDYEIELYLDQTMDQEQLINDVVTKGISTEQNSEIISTYEA